LKTRPHESRRSLPAPATVAGAEPPATSVGSHALTSRHFDALLLTSASIVWWTNAAGEFVEEQPHWHGYTGQSLQEYQGSGWVSCLHPDEQESVITAWKHAVASGDTYFNQGRIWSAKHGAYRRFQTHAIAIRNEGGEVLEWYGTLVDVQDAADRQTELKDIREDLAQTLQALRVSEARSRMQAEQLRALSAELGTTLNTAGIGIVRCSRDLRYLRANDTYATIVGSPLEEIIGRPIVEVIGEAAFNTIRPYIERVLAGERVEFESAVPLHKGVASAFFRVVYVPDRDCDGSVIGWIACISDITASKHAEHRLAEHNAQLDLAGKVARIGSFTYDHATQKLQLSRGCAAIYGLPESTLELSREDWRARVHPDDLPRLDTIARRAMANGEAEFVLEFRILCQGEVRWIESRVLIVYSEVGKPVRRVGAQIDVTERKNAELALAVGNAQLALAGRAARVGNYTYDVNKGTMQVSEGYLAIHGLPEGTTETSYSEWRARVHPEDLERTERLRNQAFADRREEDNAEYRIVIPTGEVRWIERRGSISYGEDGCPERVVGVNIDITERKRTELALAERNLQFALAGKAGLVGSYAYDVSTEKMQVSEGYAAIHGLPEGTTETTISLWKARVYPGDLERAEKHRAQTFADQRGEYSLEYRILRSDGEVRWIERRSFISYDGDGRPQRVVGVVIDVTERKQAEEHRNILNAELDHRVKNMLATVCAIILQTQRANASTADFVASVDHRIKSLASTHELLSHSRWHGASLLEIIRREFAPYTAGNTEISGPSITLKPDAAQVTAMVLHELATNAAKYGALSNHSGRVLVRWFWLPNGIPHHRLAIEWQEIGGPPVLAPSSSGYGTSIIRELVPYELGGTVDLAFAPSGVQCRLVVPARCVSRDQRSERPAPTQTFPSKRRARG
jgi:PAS domain S-box-containing protein